MASHFKQTYVDDLYEETSASPMAASSITKLSAGQGARKFASTSKRLPNTPGGSAAKKGILIGVALAAILVIVAGFLLVRALLASDWINIDEKSPDEVPPIQNAEVNVNPETGAVESEGVAYLGVMYSLKSVDGTMAVVGVDELGNKKVVFVVEGTPAQLLLYNGILLVPENLPDGWDVIAYVLGAESQASPVVGADGNPVTGSGEVTQAYIDGSELVVTDSTGATTRIML